LDFSLTADQLSRREAILSHCSRFSAEYWLERDREGLFKSMVEAGWIGIAMPTGFGGSGAGHDRSGGHAAGGRGVGCLHDGCLEHPPAGVWLATGRALRRYLRESLIPRTAPVSPHMILSSLQRRFSSFPSPTNERGL
jgi:hypothetical protein